jgi:hypothetical protein
LIFNFSFEVLKKASEFWVASFRKLIQLPACSDHVLYGHRQVSFPPNRAPEMPESQQLFFGLRIVSRIFEEFQHPTIQTKIVQPFGGFFEQINICQPIGRKDSIQTVIRASRRLDSFLYEAAQKI